MKTELQGVQIASPQGAGCGSHFITVPRAPGESFDSVLERAMAALQDTGATLVSMDILGLPFASGLAAVEAVTGPLTWPLLWIAGPRLAEAGGIQLWAENEAAVERAKTIILEKARDRKDWAVPEYAADNLSEEDYTVEVVAEAIDISIAPAPVVEPKPAKVKKTKKVRTKK